MARDDATSESRITADREMIEGWAGEHDAVPVRYVGTEGESGRLRIVPRETVGESHEELEWEEFYDAVERDDRVVIYHGEEGETPFEVVDRGEAVGRASLDDEEVERRLLDGETVVSEITETTVIERTLVEEATIESEITGREAVSDDVVDAELLTREVTECRVEDVADADEVTAEEGYVAEQFEAGYRSSDRLEVEVDVDETWSVTREELERLTVESRIVDVDATEIDTVEDDRTQSTVALESVQRSLLESGLLESDAEQYESVESRTIESEFREGDLVETRLIERRTVEDEVRLRRQYAGEITDGETVTSDTVHSEVVESELVETEELEAEGFEVDAMLGAGGVGAAAAGAGERETTGDVEDGTPTDARAETMAEAGTTTAPGADEELRTTPMPDDEGKHVVDAAGDDVGVVVDVEGETLLVDPHPSITERIKAALGWGDIDEEDTYPISASQVATIEPDRVELATEEHVDEADVDDERTD